MGKKELQAARSRFSDASLDNALKTAWSALVAAGHPAAVPQRALHTRKLIAEAIIGAALNATDAERLWLAGIDAFRREAFPRAARRLA